jgi:predicted enzyme related to lactoylglutathione lyase
MTPDRAENIGRSGWFDLCTTDLADTMSFYEGLLSWKYQQMQNSPLSDYVMVEAGGKLIGGLRRISVKSQVAADVSMPILYFTVNELVPKLIRAKELGARIVGSMVDLGKGRGRYQWIQDRAGNVIGLWGQE